MGWLLEKKSNDLLVQTQLLVDLSLGPGGEFGQIFTLSRSRQLNSHHTQLIKCPGGWRSTRGEGH